jgi:hypothetical protein
VVVTEGRTRQLCHRRWKKIGFAWVLSREGLLEIGSVRRNYLSLRAGIVEVFGQRYYYNDFFRTAFFERIFAPF